MKRVGSLHEGRSTAFSYRPERHDVVLYEAWLDLVKINAETDGERDLYRKAFGLHLFGSENYFPGDGKFTLEPLRRAGHRSLEWADVPGIDWVKLRTIEYCWPGYSDEVVLRKSEEDLLPLLGARRLHARRRAHTRDVCVAHADCVALPSEPGSECPGQ